MNHDNNNWLKHDIIFWNILGYAHYFKWISLNKEPILKPLYLLMHNDVNTKW